MKWSLGIFNFLEEISSLSILLFSSISLHWSLRKAFLPLCYFWNSDSNGYLFPFLLCFSLLFFSQQFVRPPQTTILLFCISFLKEVNTATIGKRRCACKQDSLLGQNVLANKMFCQGVWTEPWVWWSLANEGTFPSCDKEEERALDRLCSKQEFHSLLLYDNIYAHALYWEGLVMQSGILPRGLFIKINRSLFAQFFSSGWSCVFVCFLCVCVLSLCHFARNIWHPTWGSSETQRVSNPGRILYT